MNLITHFLQGRRIHRADDSLTRQTVEIFDRKNSGLDCTEDESAIIKRYFDRHNPEHTLAGMAVASAFPLEYDEWGCEFDNGDRPLSFP